MINGKCGRENSMASMNSGPAKSIARVTWWTENIWPDGQAGIEIIGNVMPYWVLGPDVNSYGYTII